MFLIYVHGMKGPQPQKVETIPTDGHGRPIAVLAKHELKRNGRKVLEQLDPAPKVTNG